MRVSTLRESEYHNEHSMRKQLCLSLESYTNPHNSLIGSIIIVVTQTIIQRERQYYNYKNVYVIKKLPFLNDPEL